MKFENIQKGDTVYIKVDVKTCVFGAIVGSFFLPKLVEKVTKKSFDVDGARYNKEYGNCKGGKGEVYILGDEPWRAKVPVYDQTEEYKAAIIKRNKIINADKALSYYSIQPDKWTNEELDVLTNLLNKNKWSD